MSSFVTEAKHFPLCDKMKCLVQLNFRPIRRWFKECHLLGHELCRNFPKGGVSFEQGAPEKICSYTFV
jgi:hypothetical protein